MKKTIQFIYKDKLYDVEISYKRIRNAYFRFKNEKFYVSCNRLFSLKKIEENLTKFAPNLLKEKTKIDPINNEKVFILGEEKPNIYKDFYKEIKTFALSVFESRTRLYESIMGISRPYKVKTRKMTSRYGSNSYTTHSITYNINLIHFSLDIIDSVVIHELTHDKVRNHQKQFYDVLFKYCPSYKELKKKLRKGIYS